MARVLSVIESSVLNLVPQGMDNRRNLKEIASLIDLDVRSVQEIINRLISYGVPICAFRGNNQSGVYIPTSQEELRLGTRAVKSQIKEMMIMMLLILMRSLLQCFQVRSRYLRKPIKVCWNH